MSKTRACFGWDCWSVYLHGLLSSQWSPRLFGTSAALSVQVEGTQSYNSLSASQPWWVVVWVILTKRQSSPGLILPALFLFAYFRILFLTKLLILWGNGGPGFSGNASCSEWQQGGLRLLTAAPRNPAQLFRRPVWPQDNSSRACDLWLFPAIRSWWHLKVIAFNSGPRIWALISGFLLSNVFIEGNNSRRNCQRNYRVLE